MLVSIAFMAVAVTGIVDGAKDRPTQNQISMICIAPGGGIMCDKSLEWP